MCLSWAGYAGWQRQPNALSVQQCIEETITTFLGTPTTITGCGRTDAGVHASQYVFHFDTESTIPPDFMYRINRMLPVAIAILDVRQVAVDLHARFSATSRSYTYHVTFAKDPFSQDTAYYYPYPAPLDIALINQATDLIRQASAFKPFCKTGSDTPHFLCDVTEAKWEINAIGATFHITANRFLRGMVRLIVGTLLNVGRGKIKIEELRIALESQQSLTLAESAPAHGLFLTEVRY